MGELVIGKNYKPHKLQIGNEIQSKIEYPDMRQCDKRFSTRIKQQTTNNKPNKHYLSSLYCTMRYIAPILLFALAVIAGCKEKYVPNPDVNLVKTQSTIGTQSTTEFFTYDATGRMVIDSQQDIVSKYSYQGNRVIDSTLRYGVASVDIYFLNTQGLVASDLNGEQWFYNTDSEVIQIIDHGDTIFYGWSNGDQVTKQEIIPHDTTNETATYLNTPDNRNFGQPYFGKTSFHLASFIPPNMKYSYTFDVHQRVSTMITSFSPTAEVTTTYTYY